MTGKTTVRTMCRVCHMSCPIYLEIEDGVPQAISGDREAPLHQGYTCIKGRELPRQHTHPDRLLHSLKRTATGFEQIPVEQAMDEIAERLAAIIAERGPFAVANYGGTMVIANPLTSPAQLAFADAIGGYPAFSANSIDQPGKSIAKGFHGMWMSPHQGLDDSDVALFIGINPLISTAAGLSYINPRRWLADARARGFRMIVIDPRRTETATQAELFLQPRPGVDIPIVAALLHVILRDGLHDAYFVGEEVGGLDALRAAVEPFTPDVVAGVAGVGPDELEAAARMFATGGRGCALAGTGPNMSSARGTLFEYLMLCLNTICGRWLRAGERVWNPGTVVQTLPHKAQAIPPFRSHGIGTRLSSRDLASSLAGPPTAALADEILTPGERQVRALISCAGNPVVAWPDQLKVVAALKDLELLVQVDPWMSATAKMADYVIAPRLTLETAGTTWLMDLLVPYAPGIGVPQPWAHWTPAVVDPPVGSDVIAEWELYYGLAKRLGLPMQLKPFSMDVASDHRVDIDMRLKPTEDELIEGLCVGSRVPLAEVKRHVGGALFPEPAITVDAKADGWTGRLDVGSDVMLGQLADVLTTLGATGDPQHPMRLISRRLHTRYNSSGHVLEKLREATPTNAANMHPDDLVQLGCTDGDIVRIASPRASILGVVRSDPTVRRGVVSMAHAWGDLPEHDPDVAVLGAPTGRLVDVDGAHDPFSGQPIMSAIPIRIERFDK